MASILHGVIMVLCFDLSNSFIVSLHFLKVTLSAIPSDDVTVMDTNTLLACSLACYDSISGSCTGFRYIEKQCSVFRGCLELSSDEEPFTQQNAVYMRKFQTQLSSKCCDKKKRGYKMYETPTGMFCFAFPIMGKDGHSVARDMCSIAGAVLAFADSQNKIRAQKFVYQSVKGFAPKLWAGLSRLPGEEAWTSSTGQTVFPLDPVWEDTSFEEICAVVGTAGLLQDVDCFEGNWYLCEILL